MYPVDFKQKGADMTNNPFLLSHKEAPEGAFCIKKTTR